MAAVCDESLQTWAVVAPTTLAEPYRMLGAGWEFYIVDDSDSSRVFGKRPAMEVSYEMDARGGDFRFSARDD